MPDPGSKRFPDPGSASASASKNLNILTLEIVSKLSEILHDPGSSSRIRIPDAGIDFLPIPDPGIRGQKGTGSRIPDPQHWFIETEMVEFWELSKTRKTQPRCIKEARIISLFQLDKLVSDDRAVNSLQINSVPRRLLIGTVPFDFLRLLIKIN
jgi:hypothetical protein